MTQSYEMMYILRPDLSEDQVQQEINKYKEALAGYGATNIQVQPRGKRRLAYPIKKHLDGVYVQINYEGDGSQIARLERDMRLSEEVIRYLTLKLKDTNVAEVAEVADTPVVEPEAEAIDA